MYDVRITSMRNWSHAAIFRFANYLNWFAIVVIMPWLAAPNISEPPKVGAPRAYGRYHWMAHGLFIIQIAAHSPAQVTPR